MKSPFGRNPFSRHRIESRIIVVFLILASAALLFLSLGSEVLEGETFAFDPWLLAGLRSTSDPSLPVGPAWLRSMMIDLTALGGVSVLTIITVIATGYLLAVRKYATASFLVAAVTGGALASTLLKTIYARPRPELVAHLVEVNSASFPSGHAMNSAITYLTIGVLLARAEQDRRVRIYLLTVAIALTLAIGFSRVYLGVHWPSDVIAGWCVGGTWAILCSLAARRFSASARSNRRIPPPPDMGG
ncbi:MAG TPA: phosphatase PAP2 family protein [Allosphingosinicella sp.]|nr:phosphatase PAP2 family protein [Allosphingosinicella sp.]